MKHRDHDNGAQPIGKFKHFKGIYIDRTKEYFLCDFYEVTTPDNTMSYRVQIEVKDRNETAELWRDDDDHSWKFGATSTTFPIELEEALSGFINDFCLTK